MVIQIHIIVYSNVLLATIVLVILSLNNVLNIMINFQDAQNTIIQTTHLAYVSQFVF